MLLLFFVSGIHAQTVVSDTLVSDEVKQPQPTDDEYRIVTNRFWDNWFILGDIGGHAYAGDYGSVGDFSGLLSPDFNVGIGKWFTPGIGAKIQFGLSNSKGYSKEETYFTYGEPLTAADGSQYWKSKNKWWDLNINAMFNLSRLIKGYEGKDSERLKNQFIASVGIGALHHRDIDAQRNEWSGHFELQYSRFFSKKKNISLDVKAHAILFQTNFDGITLKKTGEDSKWWDSDIGLSVGVTYYFKKRHWDRCVPCQSPVYINNTYMPAPVLQECPEYRTLEFYVFFPNNYSGRDDAPIVADATVNAIDYLASGIFTQRRFKDTDAVAGRLSAGGSLVSLATADIPTEKANRCEPIDGVARGYEMSGSPISLSMDAGSMRTFEEKMDYFYAPIYEGGKTWHYRVDKETTTQSLLSDENYRESTSYGLNAHTGLNTIKKNMKVSADAALYSFADIYAAIEGNSGYVAQAADESAVKELDYILKEGRILYVQAEGLATSQDNYIGENAENVGLERNKTLAYNRAYTVIKWLRGNAMFKNVQNNDFSINALTDPIVTVNDKSTQGLNAKLNRCVKVRIHCVIDK